MVDDRPEELQRRSPHEAGLAPLLHALQARIHRALHPVIGTRRWGFALLVYPVDDPTPDKINFISNMPREHVEDVLRGIVKRWGPL